MAGREEKLFGLVVLGLCSVLFAWTPFTPPVGAAEPPSVKPRKIVLIAGTKSHGPGHHEYEQGLRLVKHCLEHSPNVRNVALELYLDGWPTDEKVLDDAASIVLFCDGSDRDPHAHPLLRGERLEMLRRQMLRGCGFVAIHYTVFVPVQRGGEDFLEWLGGFFDYESGPPPRKWYSKIQHATTTPQPVSPYHPISRGLAPFRLREEYYYNIRFRANDQRLTPILTTALPGETKEQVVAWAVERRDGGRGFGFTGGHFHDNWEVAQYRKMLLNAIVWSAKLDVPMGGVESRFPTSAELAAVAVGKPIPTLIVTGHQYPGHLWRETTPALKEALSGLDRRFAITIVEDPEFLSRPELDRFAVVVFNYCNWERKGLSESAKNGFTRYLRQGGGLVLIHFANGAFHYSLPHAADSDWEEWRTKICRRVWDHTPGKSGHDAYGPFTVDIVPTPHPITRGMKSFATVDELYFRQQGNEPITVLATARSKVTGQHEPMAFVYEYGKGRVFQTVLGHDARSLRSPGTAELIGRGAAWAAQRDPQARASAGQPESASKTNTPTLTPPGPLVKEIEVPGQFGKALDARLASVEVARQPHYARPPFTVETWARVFHKQEFQILAAMNPKESADHWEIYTYAGTGEFSAYLPGYEPAEIKSGVSITDGAWHFVTMAFDGKEVRLDVDGRTVQRRVVRRARQGGPEGPLWIGAIPPHGLGCAGFIDEVRLSNSVRPTRPNPTQPLPVDEYTVGLWRFDQLLEKRFADESPHKNPALLKPTGKETTTATASMEYHLVDPDLQLVHLDYSEDESFLSLRLDSMGQLFVGCREALFVYEPTAPGSSKPYGPRRLLFRFPADTWINDIEIRGDDVYCLTTSALYRFPGARVAREPVPTARVQRLIWGTPVDLHVTYHGLAWGPEGDLYFSSGDPLLTYGDFAQRPDHWGHWTVYTQPQGTKIPFTGTGGFYRCRPDGSNFQVVAQGTRGCFGMAFDRRWELFSNDNDHESIPARYVPGRLLHVTPHANFFWPRGWMASLTPERADLLDTVFDGLGRAVPVGQAYYDESFLPERFRDNLLVARWGQRRIDRYPLARRGASFKASEYPLLVGSGAARPVGVAVGRGGRIFAAISHLPGNAYSPKYPSDLVMITRRDDSSHHPFAAYEPTVITLEKLWRELESPSWHPRQMAHQEILRRAETDPRVFQDALLRWRKTSPDHPAWLHLSWIAAGSGHGDMRDRLVDVGLHHTDSEIRRQALSVLSAFPQLATPPSFWQSLLADRDARIVHRAVLAYFDRAEPIPTPELIPTARTSDTYVRQALAFLLARRGTMADIMAFVNAPDARARLIGVLAAGFRLTVPRDTEPLPAGLKVKIRRAGHIWDAITVLHYAGETVDLEKLGNPIGSYTSAEKWKQLSHTQEEETLFVLLQKCMDESRESDGSVRWQAAYFLFLLDDSRTNELAAKTRDQSAARHLAELPWNGISEAWRIGPFTDVSANHAPVTGPIDLSARLAAGREATPREDLLAWRIQPAPFILPAQPGVTYFYTRLTCTQPRILELRCRLTNAQDNTQVAFWNNGSAVGSLTDKENTVARFALEPGSSDIVARVVHQGAATAKWEFRATGLVSCQLPENLGLGNLAERLRAGSGAVDLTPFTSINWEKAAALGNAERGRKLFGADGLGCVKCHGILPGQNSGGGPSLTDAHKRFTVAHLVESVLAPNKQIAPAFRATLVLTTSGETVSGLSVEENDHGITLLLPNGTRRTLEKKAVEERKQLETSAMPANLVKSPEELRDLLAYLRGGNPKAP